jgi:hypothetical protein
MNRLQLAVEQIVSARGYTANLLAAIDPADWFTMPAGCPTHVAWQVGHLAMAQYKLGMERIRGKRPVDADLIPDTVLRAFARLSAPSADKSLYPSAVELLFVFEHVHRQLIAELRQLDEASLDQPIEPPHPIARTRFESLMWCAQHEMLHAGQIGLVRRMLGGEPLW